MVRKGLRGAVVVGSKPRPDREAWPGQEGSSFLMVPLRGRPVGGWVGL